MFSTATLTDVLDFILDEADESDLDNIYEATKKRHDTLRAKRAAVVRVGAEVTLSGIRPKYHEGLTGVVTKIDGKYATIRFDVRSTDVLRYKGARRYYIPVSTTEYETGGFPLSTCRVTS